MSISRVVVSRRACECFPTQVIVTPAEASAVDVDMGDLLRDHRLRAAILHLQGQHATHEGHERGGILVRLACEVGLPASIGESGEDHVLERRGVLVALALLASTAMLSGLAASWHCKGLLVLLTVGRWAGLAGNGAPASSTRPYLSREQAARAVSRKWVKNGTKSDSYDGYDDSVERGTLRDILCIEPEPLLQ